MRKARVLSWRTCPQCMSRATKIFSTRTGRLRCQLCEWEYDPPEKKEEERPAMTEADELVKLADKVRDWMPSQRNLLTFVAHERRLIETALRRLAEAGTRKAAPVAWVIPGDDKARDNGAIDAMAWREGEFTKPLYAAPPAPSVDYEHGKLYVFDGPTQTFHPYVDHGGTTAGEETKP